MDVLQDRRIPVTVVSGFLGSGKTTLLNRLITLPKYARALIVINEFGAVGVDHALVHAVGDDVVLLAGGCICCTVRGGLVNCLREQFLAAMQRKIAPFDQVLIETTGIGDMAPVRFTLRHDFFLAERFVLDSCITVVDAAHIAGQLAAHRSAVSQVALADQIVISKAEGCAAGAILALRDTLAAVNPAAPIYTGTDDFIGMLAGGRRGVAVAPLHEPGWLGAALTDRMRGPGGVLRHAHGRVRSFTVSYDGQWSRGAFMAAVEQCLSKFGDVVLRIKGLLSFAGPQHAGRRFAVHAVHRMLYPIEAIALPVDYDAPARCDVVVIVDGKGLDGVERDIRAAFSALAAPS